MGCKLSWLKTISIWLAWAGAGLLPARIQAEESLAAVTVVVHNSLDAASISLAEFYAEKRQIPPENRIGLPLPLEETISRETFQEKLAGPFREEMVRRGFWQVKGSETVLSRIRYVVLLRGVPLKIRPTLPPPKPEEKRDPIRDRDEASVDSELAALGMNPPVNGFVANPYYRRFTPAIDAGLPAGQLLVTRLDGPDDILVRSMIQDSLLAEKRGLWGWGYLDLRGINSGPYKEGDDWLNEAARQLRRKGVPVITERTGSILPQGFPVTQAAVYYGWYAGAASGALGGTARFQPGAIAVHIHSYSAASLRNPAAGWTAPLLVQGAAVSAGNVYEPYLSTTLHLDVFQDRLMCGMNVADAAYMATPVLSWMSVVVGDPLYRPYLAWNGDSPDEPAPAAVPWVRYRDIVLQSQGDVLLAGLALKRLARDLPASMPLESLANAQRDAGELRPALASLEQAQTLAAPGSPEYLRIVIERIWLLRSLQQKSAALALATRAISEEKSPAGLQFLQQLAESMLPKPTPSPSP